MVGINWIYCFFTIYFSIVLVVIYSLLIYFYLFFSAIVKLYINTWDICWSINIHSLNNTRLLTSYNLYIPVTPFNGALRYKTEFFVVLYQLNRAKVKKDNTSFDLIESSSPARVLVFLKYSRKVFQWNWVLIISESVHWKIHSCSI